MASEVKKDKESQKILRTFLSSLARDKNFSGLFLFNPDQKHKENIEKILKSDSVGTRVLLSEALCTHPEIINDTMLNLWEAQSPIFFEYMNVLFYQLADPESEIGLKLLKLLLKITEFAVQLQKRLFFLEPEALKYLELTIEHPKDVVRMRAMELVAAVATKKPEYFDILKGFYKILIIFMAFK